MWSNSLSTVSHISFICLELNLLSLFKMCWKSLHFLMWWRRHILFSAIYAYTVTHWGLVTPYGDIDLGKIGSGNCFLPGHSKPLTESMLTHHQWRPLPFSCRQFHRNFWISPIKECLIIYTKTPLHIPGANEVIVHLILICFQLSSMTAVMLRYFARSHQCSD